ncbi:3-isopropylmalate dehydratase [Neobacillus citreus]|uniref:3-isopropylmalate dehydratase n=1 Tax=Neobacillus citreus TaxID=2833578 RepID=A0A9J6MPF1_9BACI|nr:3-isopropylmalate dehydratase [Neobacillus citreus]MCH6265306.1 3-isopropylmalate dehydratase [Neobacillus citreus]
MNKLDILKGRVIWIFDEEHFDIDRVVGIENIKETNVENLVKVCMKEYESDFVEKIQKGDWIIGGRNFGYGHPHKPPMLVLRHLGLAGIIAESFSPGFYRGQVADGVPLIKCEGILKKVKRFDSLTVNWNESYILNESTKEKINYAPLPASDRNIIELGGHIEYLKKRFASGQKVEN